MALALAGVAGLSVAAQAPREWRDYAGGPDSSRFVAATQITKANVQQLEVAWTYPAGPDRLQSARRARRGLRPGPNSSFVALDAATGKQIWIHKGVQGFNGRGVNYWESKDGKDRRLIFSANNMLQEIDAQTGREHRRVRRERPGRSARRAGSRSGDGQPAEPHAGTRLREPHHPGIGDEPGIRVRARATSARSTCARGTGLDVSHGAAARRVRLRHLARGRVEDRRRRQQLGRAVDRREARHHLRPDREPQVQLLRRQPARAPTSSATASSRSTSGPASGSGISRRSTTTSGISTTTRPRS